MSLIFLRITRVPQSYYQIHSSNTTQPCWMQWFTLNFHFLIIPMSWLSLKLRSKSLRIEFSFRSIPLKYSLDKCAYLFEFSESVDKHGGLNNFWDYFEVTTPSTLSNMRFNAAIDANEERIFWNFWVCRLNLIQVAHKVKLERGHGSTRWWKETERKLNHAQFFSWINGV